MSAESVVVSNINLSGSFKKATGASPVTVVPIKPEVVPDIVNNLGKLKGRTDDSDVVRNGDTYSFVDKRTNMPLAELNTKDNTLSLYKSPRDMAQRIDSAFISEKTIINFINESRVPQQPEIAQVAATPMAVTR